MRRRRRCRPPTYARRVERFANLFGERHFPLYAPIIEFWTEAEDEPPWSWLRRGIPFDLMGFGYDGLHEMWNGYREGLSAMALLVKPPDAYYDGPDGLRVAWLESAAAHIPQETLLRVPEGRNTPGRPDRGAEREQDSRGRRKPAPGSWARPGNFFLDHNYEDGSLRRLRRPLGGRDHRGGQPRSGSRASALMDSVCKLGDWLEEDLPGRFAEMLDFALERLPEPRTRTGGRTMTK